MPCYNSECYIKEAIESVVAQTYPNWRLIVVNDGSTDNTLKILNSYALNDKRIEIITKENGGYVSAVNCGLEKISGDYFLMMGSDDRLSENLFFEIVQYVKDMELPDVIGFKTLKYVNNCSYENDVFSNFNTVVYKNDTSINEFEKEYPFFSKIFFVRDTSKCFKTNLLGNLRYFGEYGVDSDGIFSALFVNKCNSFLCIPTVGYYWTIRKNSVSATINKQKNLDRISIWLKFIKELKKFQKTELTVCEKKYLFYIIKISIDLLNSGCTLSFSEKIFIHKAMKRSLKFAERSNVSSTIYLLPKNTIKRKIFINMPFLWLKRYGFLIKN